MEMILPNSNVSVNTIWCFTPKYFLEDNTGMDIVSTRRKRLRHLIKTKYEGSQARFIGETGINQGELSGLLRDKSFGEKRARSLEVAAKLPAMYLDMEVEADTKPVIQFITSALESMDEKDIDHIRWICERLTRNGASKLGESHHSDKAISSDFEDEKKGENKKRGVK